jgi:hypothetical protein
LDRQTNTPASTIVLKTPDSLAVPKAAKPVVADLDTAIQNVLASLAEVARTDSGSGQAKGEIFGINFVEK